MKHWDQKDVGTVRPVARQHRGTMADLAGRAAEERVALDYQRRGYALAARRWRGRSGEIDLIFRRDDTVVFVEVKQARDFDRAICSLGQRQIGRIFRAAEEFVGDEPMGSLTDIRIDLGLVDGTGDCRILENALAA